MVSIALESEDSFIDVVSPLDGAPLGQVPNADPESVGAVAAGLRQAQLAWATLHPKERATWLGSYRDWLLDHEAELSDLIRAESGKIRHEARAEISVVADLINYMSRIAPGALRAQHPAPHGLLGQTKRLAVSHRPYELVGVIAPWNFPLAMAFMDAVPALLAGCSVLTKPSEVTPLSLSRAADGWGEIGAPPVLAAVTGGPRTGQAVVNNVDYVQFTGSTLSGRQVAIRAAERLIPCSLELGGKDPMIVLADADLDRAAQGAAWGGLFNSGQACVAVERIYVEAPVYDEFLRKLMTFVESLVQSQDGDLGSMTSEAQLDLVEQQVRDAVATGARVLTGGARTGRGLEYAPTILVDVDHSMDCMQDETFGPLLPVMRVADVDEAVQLANDSQFGLSASVWTRSIKRGREVAARLEVGAVNVNDVMANLMSYSIPQSGWKASGLGSRFGGAAALIKFCRPQAMTVPWVAPSRELNWFPYTEFRSESLHRAVRAVVGRGKRRIGR